MANEESPNNIHELWRKQPLEAAEISVGELRHRANLLEMKMRRGLRGMVALMLVSAAGYATLLYFFPDRVQRIGASLTLAGYVYSFYEIYKRRSVGKAPSALASTTALVYRAELMRQRDFFRDAWRTLLLPFVPGPAVFMLGSLVPGQGPVRAVGLTIVLVLSPFAFVVPLLNKRAHALQREIDGLDCLMSPIRAT
jgi:hypothetical protein